MKTHIPDAFKKNLPRVKETDAFFSLLSLQRPTKTYKAGKLYASYSPAHDGKPALLIVNHPDRYPTWDEVVWIRYNVAPEGCCK